MPQFELNLDELAPILALLEKESVKSEKSIPDSARVEDSSLVSTMMSQGKGSLEGITSLITAIMQVLEMATSSLDESDKSASHIGSISPDFMSLSSSDSSSYVPVSSLLGQVEGSKLDASTKTSSASTTAGTSSVSPTYQTEDIMSRVNRLSESYAPVERKTHPLEKFASSLDISRSTYEDFKNMRDTADSEVRSSQSDFLIDREKSHSDVPSFIDYENSSSDAGSTSLSSASSSGEAGSTTLSAAHSSDNSATTLSEGGTAGNSYTGYSASGSHTGAFPDSTKGFDITTNLSSNGVSSKINSIIDESSKGAGIFKSITYTPYYEDGDYGEYGSDFFDDYSGGVCVSGEGYEGQFSVGTPVDVTAMPVEMVTFERPVDGALSGEELDLIIDDVLDRAGIYDEHARYKWAETLTLIATHESNLQPAAANGWDSNAVGETMSDGYPSRSSRGLMQCIPGTFAANHMAGTSTSIYDPTASMGAAVNYLKSRYGCDEMGNGLDAFYSARVPTYKGY